MFYDMKRTCGCTKKIGDNDGTRRGDKQVQPNKLNKDGENIKLILRCVSM